MNNIELRGIKGSNPCGFLAALGVLKILHLSGDTEAMLRWDNRIPVLSCNISQEIFASEFFKLSQVYGMGAMIQREPLIMDCIANYQIRAELKTYRSRISELMAKKDWTTIAVLESLMNDIKTVDKETSKQVETGLFITVIGAGNHRFLDYADKLYKKTTEEQISNTLFKKWQYDDDGLSLHYDPQEFTKLQPKNERGGNRLAMEGLLFFPTALNRGRTIENEASFFYWPLWDVPLSSDSISTLIDLPQINGDLSKEDAKNMGITNVYKSEFKTYRQAGNPYFYYLGEAQNIF